MLNPRLISETIMSGKPHLPAEQAALNASTLGIVGHAAGEQSRPNPTTGRRERSVRRARRGTLFVSVSAQPGGAERSLQLLIDRLANQGWPCALAASAGMASASGAGLTRGQLCSLHPFEPVRHPTARQALAMIWHWAVDMLHVSRIARQTQPAIIHANTTPAMLVALLPACMGGYELIWHVRDLVRLGCLARLCSAFASIVICVSHAVRQHLLLEGVATDKLHVVYNGTMPSESPIVDKTVAREQLRARLGFARDAFIYANVGRFLFWKKQDVFLRAAAIVASRDAKAHFVVVGGAAGTSACADRLRSQIRELGLASRSVLLDWQEEVLPILCGCDTLVHTAQTEPFGRVLIEAMDVGLPVIAVAAAGPAEIVEDNVSGLLASPGDVVGLARLMQRIKHEPELAGRLAVAGRCRVAARFRADHTTAAVKAIYERVLATEAAVESGN